MKMNQIVYVVINAEAETLLGAYNEYEDALTAIRGCNSDTVSITPVAVDVAPDCFRTLIYSADKIEDATNDEIQLAYEAETDEDEDEDYDDDDDEYDEDEDEDEEEDDDENDVIPDFSALAWLLESLL